MKTWNKMRMSVAAGLAFLLGMPMVEQAVAQTVKFVVLPIPWWNIGGHAEDSGS